MEILSQEGDWYYLLTPLDTSSSELGPFSSFIDLWRARSRNGKLPAWRDFELADFHDWWGWITVIDFLSDDPGDHRYRLWGSRLARTVEFEMTGLCMKDNWGDENHAANFTDVDLEFLTAMRKGGNIGYYSGPVDLRFPGVQLMQTLRLPLADDGTTVDRVMSAVIMASPEEAWRPPILDDRPIVS